MDPEATLAALIDACAMEERAEAIEACEALADWLAKGGAFPNGVNWLHVD